MFDIESGGGSETSTSLGPAVAVDVPDIENALLIAGDEEREREESGWVKAGG